MSIFKGILVVLLFVFSLGAGPCEVMEDIMDDGAGDDSGVNCGEEQCENVLVIEMLNADSMGYQTGAYYFSLQTPDSSVYSIDCHIISLDWGFECELGDTNVMYPYLSETSDVIFLVIAGAPASVLVNVEFTGVSIGQREIVPTYEEVYPNGLECLPVCYTADESMVISSW